jgi:oxepin-CoA hydrolase/3-oxo-5,6-dehydrosuberyl-CoA semialdehyde dehydrogenase
MAAMAAAGTVPRLRSYAQGRWIEGAGPGTPVHNPTTEDVLAEASTGGIDFGQVVAHARARGLPALRALSFAQRGALLDEMARALHAHRDELLDLSTASGGNTRGDAKFDVDGATGTMSFYARLGRDLGDRHLLADGEPEPIGRSPRYAGQHVLVPREGVAVHINAFNFPAWGMAEKLAVAFLAGLPVIVKPATSTAPLAVRMAEILVASGHLPEAALSLIAGSCGDLVDHLGVQDVLAFTGSSDTGRMLRSKPNIVAHAVRVNIEADSLNAAVLGPDVEVSSDTWELFLREVVRDMTQKAGQKCTAIRRVLVPRARLDEAVADLSARLGDVRVGDPALREVGMGPLATAAQLRDVRQGIDRLASCGRMAHGDGGRGTLAGVAGDRGYFVSPVLLVVSDPAAAASAPVHEHEVFGPVATVIPYSGDAAEASALVALGAGCLVSSIYSDDLALVTRMVAGLAPHHGRLTIGSARVAEHSPGPGTVLPGLVHGGPGRAGGGEELGGRRGLHFYFQRTAVQGFRPLLDKLLE